MFYLDSNLTVIEAIKFIGETLNVACGGNIGLYLPGNQTFYFLFLVFVFVFVFLLLKLRLKILFLDEKRWLDDNAPLSTYDNLQEEVKFRFFRFLIYFQFNIDFEN